MARPQISVSSQLGVVGLGEEGKAWRSTKLDVGARLESVFFRESPGDFGIGPYVEARTAWFAHGDYGGGLVMVLPIDQTFPIWLGGGGFTRRDGGAWAPGANGFIAWGSRSYNHHASYAMAYGLLLDARWHGGPTPGVDLVIAASIDLEGLAFPFLYLVSAIRH
jgi:hypothetical protein